MGFGLLLVASAFLLGEPRRGFWEDVIMGTVKGFSDERVNGVAGSRE